MYFRWVVWLSEPPKPLTEDPFCRECTTPEVRLERGGDRHCIRATGYPDTERCGKDLNHVVVLFPGHLICVPDGR